MGPKYSLNIWKRIERNSLINYKLSTTSTWLIRTNHAVHIACLLETHIIFESYLATKENPSVNCRSLGLEYELDVRPQGVLVETDIEESYSVQTERNWERAWIGREKQNCVFEDVNCIVKFNWIVKSIKKLEIQYKSFIVLCLQPTIQKSYWKLVEKFLTQLYGFYLFLTFLKGKGREIYIEKKF